MPKILMVISSAASLRLADGTAHPTGYWAEEVAASHRVLTTAGVGVDIATPGGVRPTVDEISLDERGGVPAADAADHRAYLDTIAEQLAHPLTLADVRADDYDAIYIPGGHAPMADLARDADLGRLLIAANTQGTTVAALCHGAAPTAASPTPGAPSPRSPTRRNARVGSGTARRSSSSPSCASGAPSSRSARPGAAPSSRTATSSPGRTPSPARLPPRRCSRRSRRADTRPCSGAIAARIPGRRLACAQAGAVHNFRDGR